MEALVGFGKIAGLAGLALGVFLLLFRDLISKVLTKILPVLTKAQAYRIVRLALVLIFAISALGILAWQLPTIINAVNTKVVVETTCEEFLDTSSELRSVEARLTECRKADLTAKLRLTYYALDSRMFSDLRGGDLRGAARRVLGDKLIVVPNDVYSGAAALVESYGIFQRFPDEAEGTVTIGDERGTKDVASLSAEDLASLGAIKVYDGEETIFMPDIDTLETYRTTDRFPADMKFTYQFLSDISFVAFEPGDTEKYRHIEAFANTILWRYLRKEELDNYAQRMAALSGLFKDRAIDHFFVELPPLPEDETVDIGSGPIQDYRQRTLAKQIRIAVESRSVAAAREVTREGWPEDFLVLYAAPNVHGGTIVNWSTYVPPRQMFVLIGVVEFLGGPGETVRLGALSQEISGETRLRKPGDDSFLPNKPFQLSKEILTPEEKLVVPLRIEFREPGYSPAWPVPPEEAAEAKGVYQRIMNLPGDRFELELSGLDETFTLRKRKDAFLPPEPPQPTDTYLYGPSIRLTGITANGLDMPLRQFDPTRVTLEAGIESGSCPFLYVATEDDLKNYGRILVNAVGRGRTATEEISLDPLARSVVIVEREPEVTQIKMIALRETHSVTGHTTETVLHGEALLSFGESLSLELPELRADVDRTLLVTGFYVPFDQLITASAPALKDRDSRLSAPN